MKAAKRFRYLAGPLLLGLTTSAWAKDDLPTMEPFAHYEPMVKRSPFAVATAGAPIAGKPDFAKDLYVANAAHSPDGDFVTIASTTDKNLKEYLNTRETIDGYSISSIQWSDRVGETKVTIAKDGQFATLTFNEALLSQAIQNPIPQIPQPQVPGRPPIPGRPPTAVQRPMPVPQIPTPPPHVRSTIRHGNTTPRTVPQQRQPALQPPGDEQDDTDEPDLRP
jgi:hypothetical protein